MAHLYFRGADRVADACTAAVARALRDATVTTGRREVAVPSVLAPERLAAITAHCGPDVTVVSIRQSAGRIDLGDLRARTSEATAAVYLETPNYLGVIEADVPEVVDMTRRLRATAVVAVDPASLGVQRPPDADVVIGLGDAPPDPELADAILRATDRAAERIGTVAGVRIRWPGYFAELVVDFSGTGATVAAINAFLAGRGIIGGRDLSSEFPVLGEAALYRVTAAHTAADFDALAAALTEAVTR